NSKALELQIKVMWQLEEVPRCEGLRIRLCSFMAHRSPGGGCSEPEAGPEAIAEKTPLSALVNRQNDLRGYSNGTPRSGRAYDTTQTNAWLNNVQNGFRDLARFLGLCE